MIIIPENSTVSVKFITSGFEQLVRSAEKFNRCVRITTAIIHRDDPLTSPFFKDGWPSEPTPIYDSIKS